ncbi:MAG: PH domain-containing protein [Pseudomonadota bacterium]
MATEPFPATEATPPDWQRVSPVAIIDMLFMAVKQGAAQALPGLVVLFATAASSEQVEALWIARGMIALMLLSIPWLILSYLRFGYRVGERRIEVRKGVLHRQRLDVEFDRIQNVSILEPFYLRPFGHAVLSIDTAGSSGKEIRLPGLVVQAARALRQQLVEAADDAALAAGGNALLETVASAAEVPEDGEELVSLSRRDVIIAGLTANFMLWAAVALGAVFGSGESWEQLGPWFVERLKIDDVIDQVRADGGDAMVAAATTGLVMLGLLLLPVISMIGALFRYDGFRLSMDGDRFRRTSGLLSKHDDSVRQHKIQGVTWKQNAIALFFGRINIQLRQASAGEGVEQMPGTGSKQAFSVPSLRPTQAESLSARFLPGYTPERAQFTRVDRRRYLLVTSAVPLLVSIWPLTGLSIAVDARIGLLWFLIAGLTLLICNRCWKQTGWAVDEDHALFRKGFIGSSTTLFPLFKVQSVELMQTPMQARRGLAHLTLHLASHSMTMPWMQVDDAERLRDLVLYRAETAREAWF